MHKIKCSRTLCSKVVTFWHRVQKYINLYKPPQIAQLTYTLHTHEQTNIILEQYHSHIAMLYFSSNQAVYRGVVTTRIPVHYEVLYTYRIATNYGQSHINTGSHLVAGV